MSFAIAKATAALLESDYDKAIRNLKSIPGVGSGPMGLTPDAVKTRLDYRIAKAAVENAFADLRKFNAVYVRRYKKELAAERKAKRGGRTA